MPEYYRTIRHLEQDSVRDEIAVADRGSGYIKEHQREDKKECRGKLNIACMVRRRYAKPAENRQGKQEKHQPEQAVVACAEIK